MMEETAVEVKKIRVGFLRVSISLEARLQLQVRILCSSSHRRKKRHPDVCSMGGGMQMMRAV